MPDSEARSAKDLRPPAAYYHGGPHLNLDTDMSQPDNFGLELASRLALHEALLENLYTNLLRKMPDAEARWQTFGQLLEQSLGALQPLEEPRTEEERQWLQKQRARSQQLAREFTAKVARNALP